MLKCEFVMLGRHKIFLVHLDRIGDLILMTLMFNALKEANPHNELHLLAGRNNYLLAGEQPLINKVHIFEKNIFYSKTHSIVDVFSVVTHSKITITLHISVAHGTSTFDTPLLGLFTNIPRECNKYHPFSSGYRMVVTPELTATFSDIDFEWVVENYQELIKEVTN